MRESLPTVRRTQSHGRGDARGKRIGRPVRVQGPHAHCISSLTVPSVIGQVLILVSLVAAGGLLSTDPFHQSIRDATTDQLT